MSRYQVTLRLYYGPVIYDENRKVTSRNETVSIQHNTLEWKNFLKHLSANGVKKATVEEVFNLDKVNKDEPVSSVNRYEKVDDFSEIEADVKAHFEEPKVALTPDQLKIKELEEKIDSLLSAKEVKTTKEKPAATNVNAAKEVK